MNGSGRAAENAPQDAGAAAGRVEFTRGAVSEAEHALAGLRQRHDDLRRQIESVTAENRQLERELLQRLGEWRKLDDGQQWVDDVLPQVRAITRTLPYRFAVGVRGVMRRILGLVARRR